MNSCTICGPTEARIVKGYCIKHYRAFVKYGDPNGGRVNYPKNCTAISCSNSSRSLGLCSVHYERFRRHGDANYELGPQTTEGRFWAKVDKGVGSDACWIWRGYTIKGGYGQLTIKGVRTIASRYSYFLAHGEWPAEQCLHSCDNPPCVNPAHLRNGSITDNMADKVERDRQLKGEQVPCAKLTESKVRDIRFRLTETGGRRLREIAKEFGVSHNTVWLIKTGRAWSSVISIDRKEQRV